MSEKRRIIRCFVHVISNKFSVIANVHIAHCDILVRFDGVTVTVWLFSFGEIFTQKNRV